MHLAPNRKPVKVFIHYSLHYRFVTINIITAKDFVGLDRLTPRLIFLVSEADLVSDTDDDELKIKKSVMRLFPQTLVRSDLLDAHLYVIHKRVCDYIAGYKRYIFFSPSISCN